MCKFLKLEKSYVVGNFQGIKVKLPIHVTDSRI